MIRRKMHLAAGLAVLAASWGCDTLWAPYITTVVPGPCSQGGAYACPPGQACDALVNQCVDATPQCSGDQFCWESPLPQGNALMQLWGSSDSDIWAAGRHGTRLHWDGSVWSSVASTWTGDLAGIWGPDADHVWVVGAGGEIEQWDGSQWTKQASPSAANLNSVSGVDASHLWAVGQSGTIRLCTRDSVTTEADSQTRRLPTPKA